MKAWTHTRAGLPSQVLSLTSVNEPEITSSSQVLVKISYCALNPGGSILMQLVPFIFRGSPAIPEMDFSGTIAQTGSDVPVARELIKGTEVFGSILVGQHVKQTSGSLAEYVVVDHSAVFKKPNNVPLQKVAGLGIAGATALELMKAAKLKEGDRVLVNGASGGIGHLVLQMCQNSVGKSGKVIATCSSSNVQWVQSYGHRKKENPAPYVIDYKQHESLTSHLKEAYGKQPFDVVIDAVGIQNLFNNSPGFLKEGKQYVTVGPKASSYTYPSMLGAIWSMAKNSLWPQRLGGTPRPYLQVTAFSNLESLKELAKMVEAGQLDVHVGTLVSMENALKAYEQCLSGHAQGKIVVKVEETS